MSIYLDCNATTPLDPVVLAEMQQFLELEYGNAGSRTHEYGVRAKKAVEDARRELSAMLALEAQSVVFTSGATESNNLALLGLADYGRAIGKRHLVTTAIEHKAVLEPLEHLQSLDFELTVVPVGASGTVSAERLLEAVRDDTLLVSVMHANNETGVFQPIEEIAESLPREQTPFFHVDAAQTFGKHGDILKHERIDLLSVSGHKIFGPKGIGALGVRRRNGNRPQLQPLVYGGGQERGLRPGTLPVHLIVGLGVAAREARVHCVARNKRCLELRQEIVAALQPLGVEFNGDCDQVLPHVVNCSIPGVDSEAAMLALKGKIAISNGSACTSSSYTPSHVLKAMTLDEDRIEGAMRISWCHLTPDADWESLITQPLKVLTS